MNIVVSFALHCHHSVWAQLELAQGNLAAALHWADTMGLSTNDEDLRYLHEGEYLALARVRIEQGRDNPATPLLQDALRLLERLLLLRFMPLPPDCVVSVCGHSNKLAHW